MGDGNDTFLVKHLLPSCPGIPVPHPLFLNSADLKQPELEPAPSRNLLRVEFGFLCTGQM